MKLVERIPVLVLASLIIAADATHDNSTGSAFHDRGAALNGQLDIVSETSSLSLSKEQEDAICYAARYPDLLEGFCQGDSSRCRHQDLRRHFEEHGKPSNLIWGCRRRSIEPAVPLTNMQPFQSSRSDEDSNMEIHFLIFETAEGANGETTLIEQSLAAGIRTTRVGRGVAFEGFSTKWHIVQDFLKHLSAGTDTLVVVTDARDVLLNIHDDYVNQEEITEYMTDHFIRAYKSLTSSTPNAVVMSAEAQCCVAALTFAEPGSYFDVNGRRSQRACASGSDGCTWGGDSKLVAWEDVQVDIAYNRTGRSLQDVYLNAGLVAGRPSDLIELLEIVDLQEYEDDQAVFTEYMYHRPEKIVLDYASEMFGTARWPFGMNDKGCPFGEATVQRKSKNGLFPALRHLESSSMPLLLHTPGKFFECYDYAARALGLTPGHTKLGNGNTKKESRRLAMTSKKSKKLNKLDTTLRQPKGQKKQKDSQTDLKKKDKSQKMKKNKNKQKTKIPNNYVVRVRGLRA